MDPTCNGSCSVLCEQENATLCGLSEDHAGLHRMTYQNAIGALFMLVIILLSIFGNTAVVLAIHKSPKLREDIANKLLINLSLIDLLSSVCVMPYSFLALIEDKWLFSDEWCTAQCALNYCCIIVSMLTLSMISIDRYVAIVFPLRYTSIITNTVVYTMATCTWLQGFAFAAIPIVCQWVVYDYWEVVCAIDWDQHRDHGGLIYVIVAFIACFIIPGGVMLYCYGRIFRESSRHFQKRKVFDRSIAKDPATEKAIRKVILSLAVVVLMFFICMSLFCVTKVIKIFFSADSVPVWLNFVATFAQFAASATNPLIYGIFRQDFRVAFSKLLCFKR